MRHEITTFLATLLLPALGLACGSSDVVLGKRGAINGPTTGGSSPTEHAAGAVSAAAGAGGYANDAGRFEATAGNSGSVAGSGTGLAGAGGAIVVSGAGGSAGASPMSSGCGLEPRSTDDSISVGGMIGTYIVELPKGYDKSRPYPLVMSFRGANVTADMFRTYLNLAAAVGSDGIVVNVNCLGDAGAWDVNRDLPYFDALLTQLESGYCIDERRVFAVGHSAGGFFANTLGCTRGDKLRGIAPLSAGPPPGTCQGELAVWMSQGNMDLGSTAGKSARDFWAKRNKCDVALSTPVEPSPCVEYAGCDVGFAVRYCEYDGDLGLPMPNFVPGGIWEFFKGL